MTFTHNSTGAPEEGLDVLEDLGEVIATTKGG
jgi:hypothetical protein